MMATTNNLYLQGLERMLLLSADSVFAVSLKHIKFSPRGVRRQEASQVNDIEEIARRGL
jgi:hypothetical protein